jgi:ribonuclease-3
MDLTVLENRIGYSFRNRQLLLEALTHPSFAYEQDLETRDNQRLEFLGDAVLQLIVTEDLFAEFPDAPEGEMTKKRAGLVCEQTLTRIALSIDLGSFLRLGHGESLSGGGANPSNLSDGVEAVLGAVYLEGGMESARLVMKGLLMPYWELASSGGLAYDYKSRLFEWAQSHKGMDLEFLVHETSGPDHDRQYTMGLYIDGQIKATGSGKTKKAAEQDASCRFLQARTGD